MPPKACCEKWSIKSFVCRPCTQSLDRCPALGRGNSWQLITLEAAPGWYEERTSDHGNTNPWVSVHAPSHSGSTSQSLSRAGNSARDAREASRHRMNGVATHLMRWLYSADLHRGRGFLGGGDSPSCRVSDCPAVASPSSSPGCISYFLVEAEIFAFRIAATLVLLEEFVRSEACQRKVTHDEDEDLSSASSQRLGRSSCCSRCRSRFLNPLL